MESIDALGARPDRHWAFSRDLLAEAEDEELKSIVEQAAREISIPIALVSLVLEEIQFFKAHYGLPADLAAARGVDRDVSFCQFVVRDGEPFEVNDAHQDQRVPQHLVREYGIRSYLGFPIKANGIVAGSLCVIDTEPRQFSPDERQRLSALADLVNARLASLSARRQRSHASLVEQSAAPALAEVREHLELIQRDVSSGHVSMASLGTFLRLVRYELWGGSTPHDVMQQTLDVAARALDTCENLFYDIGAHAGDAADSLSALEHIIAPSASTPLSQIAISGRELARHSFARIGGAFLPDSTYDPVVSTPRALGVTLVSTALSTVAAQMLRLRVSGGIRMAVEDVGSRAAITIAADELPNELLQAIAAELSLHMHDDPSVGVQVADGAIRLLFVVAPLSTG